MSDWTGVTLGDVCTKIGSGATPRGGDKVYLSAANTTLVRSQNIYNDGFRTDGIVYISDADAENLAGVTVHKYDVLLNITGDSVARVCQVDPAVLPARVNQHVAIIRPDPARLDPRYLRYVLVSPIMQSKLLSWAGSGATRNALTKSMIESLEISAPPLETQRAIAHILGTLDDKIELNRKMSQTLEEIARALFKSWFVDFDPVHAKAAGRQPVGMDAATAALFPSEFEESELGLIPKGWRIGQLSEMAMLSRASINPSQYPDELFAHYSIPAFDKGVSPVLEVGHQIKSNKYIVPTGSVLVSKLNPDIDRVWLPDVTAEVVSICSTEFLVLRPEQPFDSSYLYCLARSQTFRDALAGQVTGTSKSHQRAQPKSVMNMATLIAESPIIEASHSIVSPLLYRAAELTKVSKSLSMVRDQLLPSLISGRLPSINFRQTWEAGS